METLRYVNETTAALIVTPENRRYLTGFPSSLGYLLMTSTGNLLFVDSRYFEAASKKAVDADVVLFRQFVPELQAELDKRGVKKLLIETENSVSFYNLLKTKLTVRVTPSQPLSDRLVSLRSVKKREEVESIVAAQRIAEKAFEDVLNFIKVGVTEKETAALLEYKMKVYGAEGLAFDTIAVSGKNSSLPHGVPSDKPICEGDFVMMDFGAVINGYCSDMTRTVAVGYATDEMRKVYSVVLEANEKVIASVRAGLTCKEADGIAREVIEAAGYGEYFGHGLGHGVGLMIHEKPSVSPRNEAEKLRVGQIITDEPGIYLPEKFGVRIEDMLLVRKNSVKNLTKAPKRLIIL